MKEEEIKQIIQMGREFMMPPDDEDESLKDYVTDQGLKKPQPPLYKKPMGGKVMGHGRRCGMAS